MKSRAAYLSAFELEGKCTSFFSQPVIAMGQVVKDEKNASPIAATSGGRCSSIEGNEMRLAIARSPANSTTHLCWRSACGNELPWGLADTVLAKYVANGFARDHELPLILEEELPVVALRAIGEVGLA